MKRTRRLQNSSRKEGNFCTARGGEKNRKKTEYLQDVILRTIVYTSQDFRRFPGFMRRQQRAYKYAYQFDCIL